MSIWDTLGDTDKEALQKACDEQGVSVEAVLSSVHAISTVIVDAFNDVVEAIRCLGEDLTEACSQLAVNGDLSILTEYLMEEGWDCVPPRVRHLAFHHPKRRVRNKNWNRMWKIRERCMK